MIKYFYRNDMGTLFSSIFFPRYRVATTMSFSFTVVIVIIVAC